MPLTWIVAHPFIAIPAVVLAFAVAAWLRLRSLGRRAAATRVSEVLAELGEPSEVAEAEEGARVVLEGTLVVRGPCARPRDGKPVAVVTAGLAPGRVRSSAPVTVMSYRAEEVALACGERTVKLHGPIELRAGGSQWWPWRRQLSKAARSHVPSQELLDTAPNLWSSVAAGDRVRVSGLLGDSEGDATAYRRGAETVGLHGELVMVGMAPTRPAVPLDALVSSPVLRVLAALVAVACGVLAYVHHDDARCILCDSHGHCTVVIERLWPLEFDCDAVSRSDCEHGELCRREGKCGPDGRGYCQAVDEASCAASEVCDQWARCSYDGTSTCSLRTDADCARSVLCKDKGRCVVFRGDCVVSLEAACHDLSDCERRGMCSPGAEVGDCVVGSSADCAKSQACKSEGACGLEKNACRPTSAEHCRNSEACRTDGRCSLVDGHCVAASDEDCTKLHVLGQRHAVGGTCVVQSKEDCDVLCRERGRCAVKGEGRFSRCVAVSADDCKASTECKQFGNCILSGEWCLDAELAGVKEDKPVDCMRTQKCLESGYCSKSGKGCVVGSDADCALSDACKQQGLCSVVDGVCRAKTDVDCQPSELCLLNSQCFAVAGQCLSTPAK